MRDLEVTFFLFSMQRSLVQLQLYRPTFSLLNSEAEHKTEWQGLEIQGQT